MEDEEKSKEISDKDLTIEQASEIIRKIENSEL